MPVVDAPKKRTRAKPRKLAVQTSKVNVWDVLSKTNAGASVADLLAVDRTACKDLVDGVRYLRQGKRTAAVGSTGPHRNGSSSVPMVVDTVQPTDNDWSSVGTDGNEEDSWSEGSSVDFSVSDVDSQVSSVYRYPYSLDNMKGSSPFKGLVSINGRTVECVFDSGASVSVISGGLASTVASKTVRTKRIFFCAFCDILSSLQATSNTYWLKVQTLGFLMTYDTSP
jgi:hypothetical protein